MKWHELFPHDKKPTLEDISTYVGTVKGLWLSLISYFETAYKTGPKLAYSGCSGMPGWNIKFQKSGQAFGTWYPHQDALYVMIVVSYRLDSEMKRILPELSDYTADLYREADDYMKMGKWMMLKADNARIFEDYKKIVAVKLPPKYEFLPVKSGETAVK
ncbi:MAG: DUF3788 family protein [Clostridiales bacterium]|nr:DUF3788 family protein [Clostridiales bacterium]